MLRTHHLSDDHPTALKRKYKEMILAIYLSIYFFYAKSVKFPYIGLCFKIYALVQSKLHMKILMAHF